MRFRKSEPTARTRISLEANSSKHVRGPCPQRGVGETSGNRLKASVAPGYEGVGHAAAGIVGEGHDLFPPARQATAILSDKLPEWLTKHWLADEGVTPSREDAEKAGSS
jgi:hypothetical protein